jgi:UDP-GlcNAc:undecaprenyl-phosphate GlcNAc-1-phosphate transferase
MLSYIGVAGIRQWALHRNLLDIPNERSSHSIATPRGGGLAIAAIVLVGFTLTRLWVNDSGQVPYLGYLVGAAIVAVIGGLDDLVEVSAKVRLLVQLIAAIVFIATAGFMTPIPLPFVGELDWGWLGIPVTLLWVVGLTNAYNFMDGIDGIAAGQAIVAACLWFILALGLDLPALTILSVLIVGASLGFLLHNLPPARIFMGDVGSTVLGYTFAAMPLLAFHETGNARLFVVGILCVAPFVFDTALTMMRRALNHQHLLQAHRTHLYQRLVKVGYSHGATTALYVLLAIASSLTAYIYYCQIGWATDYLVLVVIFLLIANAAVITWLERRGTPGLPRRTDTGPGWSGEK